jgi:hypothetical protein
MNADDRDRRKVGLRQRARSLWSDHAVPAGEGVKIAGEDAAWFLRERLAWPVEDGLDELGTRGRIGVFGGGGIALAGVVAALVVATSGGSGSGGGTTEAFVTSQRSAPTTTIAPTATPKVKTAKPSGPTLHGAPPDFAPAKNVKAGIGDGKAVGKELASDGTGGARAERGSGAGGEGTAAASANETPAATAKIGANPAATASAEAQADSLATGSSAAGASVTETGTGTAGTEDKSELTGPPAPKAAKQTARRFAEAFVVYETGGVDSKVRKTFGQTTTRQLSKSLLRRPPRQPASVKVPQAKVVNVVAGPSKGTTYSVSVSLLRVGVTSELRLQMEQGPGKKWQVTNVLG